MAVNGQVVGIFTSVQYGVQYDVAPVYALGRFGPQALEYVGMSPISVSCSGWRVIDAGPYSKKVGNLVPKLQELLNAGDITLSLYDRQNSSKPIMEVFNCKSEGFSTSVANRSLQEISVNFVGLTFQDEEGEQNEPGATSLPT
jgi:hypothetical protein